MDEGDDSKAYDDRVRRRMPWQAGAAFCFMLAAGVVFGIGLRGWIPASAFAGLGIVLLLVSLRK
jgi:uncharacterized membrane protein YfcA